MKMELNWEKSKEGSFVNLYNSNNYSTFFFKWF